MLRVYLIKSPLKSGSNKPQVARSAPTTGAWGKTFIEKRKKQSKAIL